MFMVGIDVGFFNFFNYLGIGLYEELVLFVKEGLMLIQVFFVVICVGLVWFGRLDCYGSVVVGKVVDLVLLECNLLQDIFVMCVIDLVVLCGWMYDCEVLDVLFVVVCVDVVVWKKDVM